MRRPDLRLVLILAITTFTVGTAEFVLTGQLDLVAHGLRVNEAAAGQLVTVFSLAYGILTPLTVAATAQWERRRLVVTALAVFAALNAASAMTDTYALIALLRVGIAVSTGIVVVAALGMAHRALPAAHRARGIAIVVMGFTAALVLAVPAGRLLAMAFGWRSVFSAMVVLAVVMAAIVRLALPQTPPGTNLTLRDQVRVVRRPGTVSGLTITFLWLAGYGVVNTYLTPWLIADGHVPVGGVTWILLLFGLASLAGTQLGGLLSDRRGYTVALLLTLTAHVVVLALLPLTVVNMAIAVTGVLLWGVVAWGSAPPHQIRVADLVPGAEEALLALNQSVMQIAIAAGAALGGVVVATTSLTPLPWVGAAIVLASLVLLLSRARHYRLRTA